MKIQLKNEGILRETMHDNLSMILSEFMSESLPDSAPEPLPPEGVRITDVEQAIEDIKKIGLPINPEPISMMQIVAAENNGMVTPERMADKIIELATRDITNLSPQEQKLSNDMLSGIVRECERPEMREKIGIPEDTYVLVNREDMQNPFDDSELGAKARAEMIAGTNPLLTEHFGVAVPVVAQAQAAAATAPQQGSWAARVGTRETRAAAAEQNGPSVQ